MHNEKQYAVYIMASKHNGAIYVGQTSDLQRRIWEYKTDAVEGFTKKYGMHMLVYYELQMINLNHSIVNNN